MNSSQSSSGHIRKLWWSATILVVRYLNLAPFVLSRIWTTMGSTKMESDPDQDQLSISRTPFVRTTQTLRKSVIWEYWENHLELPRYLSLIRDLLSGSEQTRKRDSNWICSSCLCVKRSYKCFITNSNTTIIYYSHSIYLLILFTATYLISFCL